MKTYKVKKGDTLYQIAKDHKIELKDLIKINKITNPDLIYPGTVLTVSEKKEYTVKKGDTLYQIAKDHKMELKDLIKINNITNPDLIYPGQVLLVSLSLENNKTYYINASKEVPEDYGDIIEKLISMGFTVGVI